MYKRKTIDVWDVQGDYGQGYETVCAGETYAEAKAMIRDHRENEPGVPFRIKKTREKIEEVTA